MYIILTFHIRNILSDCEVRDNFLTCQLKEEYINSGVLFSFRCKGKSMYTYMYVICTQWPIKVVLPLILFEVNSAQGYKHAKTMQSNTDFFNTLAHFQNLSPGNLSHRQFMKACINPSIYTLLLGIAKPKAFRK